MASKRFDSGQFMCQAPWCTNKKDHDHHVVYKQHVKKLGGDVNDPRNALGVCTRLAPGTDHDNRCHQRHHGAVRRLPTECLRDENIEFAFDLMGLAADNYFDRYYTGADERVAAACQALLDMEEDDDDSGA